MKNESSSAGMPVVGLNLSPRFSDERISRSYGYLSSLIAEEGAHPVVTRGGDTFDEAKGLFQNHSVLEHTADGEVVVYAMGAIAVNSARDFNQSLDGEEFPILNHPRIRDLCGSKARMYELNSDIHIPAIVVDVTKRGELIEAISAIKGKNVVVKSARGMRGRRTYVGSKSSVIKDVDNALRSGQFSVDEVLVQEYVDIRHTPAGIRGTSETQQAKLDAAMGPRELRIYFIDDTPLLSILHVAQDAETKLDGAKWLYIDQDSVPEQAMSVGTTVVERVREQSGVQDSLLAIDLVWDRQEDRWLLMEGNGRHPVLVRRDSNDPERQQWAEMQQRGIAKKLVAMAERKTTK